MVEIQNETPNQVQRVLSGKKLGLLTVGILVALVAGYLVYSAARGSAAYYMTIEEVIEQGASERTVRVTGNVVGDSIVWDPRELRLQFDIADDVRRLPAVYHGPRPDMFRDGAQIVLEGRYSSQGIFEARTMLLKCPSKYEAAQ
jgi:cytochrome c-type biogenesis protein CcmE